MKKYLLRCVMLFLIAGATSCVKSELSSPELKPEESSEVIIRIQTPGSYSSVATRGLTLEQEGGIDNIWILAFDKTGTLVDIRVGENISAPPTEGAANTRSFTAKLKRSKDDSDTYKLVVLANTADILSKTIGTDIEKVTGDKSYASIVSRLTDGVSSKMYPDGGVIPMWSETEQMLLKKSGNAIELKLMRAIARIDVGVGAKTVNNGTYSWNGMDDKGEEIPFELTDVYIISPNDGYMAIPAVANITNGKATAPSIPTTSQKYSIEESIANFHYTGSNEITPSDKTNPDNTKGSYTTQSIYIPESNVKMGDGATSGDANHETRTAIIVGGMYSNLGRKTYYRIDIARDGEMMDILRNHLYQFNIKKVSGAGYDDIETAYRSKAVNMAVEVKEWDDSELGDVIYDGQYYFSIESRKVEFSPMGDETQTVKIKTNSKSFEMWEVAKDNTEEMKIKADGTSNAYTKEDMGYKYTLSKTSDDIYTLTIKATKHNVSNTIPDRKNRWKIKANLLTMPFEVDQKNTTLYISYVNGQSANLLPEGTEGTEKITIEVMALVSVQITSDNWIDIGGITEIPNVNGLYTAKIDVTVPVYPYAEGTLDRLGKITVTPLGEQPRVFNISQEAPFLKLSSTDENIPRSKDSYNYVGYVDVITNIREQDLKLERTTGTGDGNERIQLDGKGFYNVDKTLPRQLRFTVLGDMTNDPKVVPPTDFSTEFKVSVTNADYGVIPALTVKFGVRELSTLFKWYWFKGAMPPYDWSAPNGDDHLHYIFPWQTTQVEFDVLSNIGAVYNSSHTSNKPNGGTVVVGASKDVPEGTAYPFVVTLNNAYYNRQAEYAFYFKSDDEYGKPTSGNVTFRQGTQQWEATSLPNSATYGHKGVSNTTPDKITVTNNVLWEAFLDAWTPAALTNWLQIRNTTDGIWNSPTEVAALQADDRLPGPVKYDPANPNGANVLTTKTRELQFSIAPWTTLNPQDGGTALTTRTAKVQFTNKSYDATKYGVNLNDKNITITQYARKLTHKSGAPTKNIPASGDEYVMVANTNMQGWGVKIYEGTDNSGTVLSSQAFGTSTTIVDKVSADRTLTIRLAKNPSTSTTRQISFYLYCIENNNKAEEVKITTQTQNIRVVPSIAEGVYIGGVYWAKGNLVADGAFGCKIGAPEDDGMYFTWGGLQGWAGGLNGDGTGRQAKYEIRNKCSRPYDLSFVPNVNTQEKYMPNDPSIQGASRGYNLTTQYNGGKDNPTGGLGDACRYYLGAPWRMPTNTEWTALINATTYYNIGTPWVVHTTNGYRIFTAKNNSALTVKFPVVSDFYNNGILAIYQSSVFDDNQWSHNFAFEENTAPRVGSWYTWTKTRMRCVRN